MEFKILSDNYGNKINWENLNENQTQILLKIMNIARQKNMTVKFEERKL